MHEPTYVHASIAQRFAYGTPIDPAVDDAHIHSVPRSGTALFGVAELSDPAGAIGYR